MSKSPGEQPSQNAIEATAAAVSQIAGTGLPSPGVSAVAQRARCYGLTDYKSLQSTYARRVAQELISVNLDEFERRVLWHGLFQWRGPAHPTEEIAIAMGFDGTADLFATGSRLAAAVKAGDPLASVDWCRALLATEVVFASRPIGAALDWQDATGLNELESFFAIRSIQSKVSQTACTTAVIGNGIGTRPTPRPFRRD